MSDPSKSAFLTGLGKAAFEPITGFDQSKANMLVFASCHGRTLCSYFLSRNDLLSKFNIIRLETGPIFTLTRDGHDVLGNKDVKELFDWADVLVTYNMGARHGKIALENISKLLRPSTKVLTFTAPNCSCFWPVSYGYSGGLGLLDQFDKGVSVVDVIRHFLGGAFDPLFNLRWRLEVGRFMDKDKYHDVKLAEFVIRNHKNTKLFMAHSHPSYVTAAYIGNELCGFLGVSKLAEKEICSLNPTIATMGRQPETDYEFDHYKFTYKRSTDKIANADRYYPNAISHYHKYWSAGAFIIPAMD